MWDAPPGRGDVEISILGPLGATWVVGLVEDHDDDQLDILDSCDHK